MKAPTTQDAEPSLVALCRHAATAGRLLQPIPATAQPGAEQLGMKTPATDLERRRRADERMRDAGRVRLHAWLPAERLVDLDALIGAWGFADRAQAVDVAIRFLVQQSPTLGRLEVS